MYLKSKKKKGRRVMRKRGGFTLMELIIVVIIISVLASVAFPQFLAQIEKARMGEAATTMQSIRDAELAQFAASGAYTATFPISVDIDGDDTVDVTMALPSSANFTYSVVGAGTAVSAYVQAARTGIAGGRRSYGKCVQSGKLSTCDAAVCNPGCP